MSPLKGITENYIILIYICGNKIMFLIRQVLFDQNIQTSSSILQVGNFLNKEISRNLVLPPKWASKNSFWHRTREKNLEKEGLDRERMELSKVIVENEHYSSPHKGVPKSRSSKDISTTGIPILKCPFLGCAELPQTVIETAVC